MQQYRLQPGLFRGAELVFRERRVSAIIRPAIPRAWCHGPEVIAGAPHSPAATIVISVVSRVQLAIRRKCQTEGIPESPGYEFGSSTAGRDLHNGAAARHGTL